MIIILYMNYDLFVFLFNNIYLWSLSSQPTRANSQPSSLSPGIFFIDTTVDYKLAPQQFILMTLSFKHMFLLWVLKLCLLCV